MDDLVRWLRERPRRAFAIDGAGALLSAVTLGLVLPRFSGALGMAPDALQTLASFALLLSAYDAANLVLPPRRWQRALRVLAAGNASYPVITLAVLGRDDVAITGLGATYVALELAIVLGLSGLWLTVARSP